MIDRIDLLLLSVKAPLADAVCATVCRRWREAADLWLDVYREPPYRTLSAWCGLEATLSAGLYDLAQYFHIKSSEGPPIPGPLAELWRQSSPIKRNRTKFYTEQFEERCRGDVRRTTQHLLDLRLYREAIREIFRQRLYQTSPLMAVPVLAACYCALGEHEALIALHRSRPLYFASSGNRAKVRNAQACLSLARLGQVENFLEFTRSHPAGALAEPFLNPPETMLPADG